MSGAAHDLSKLRSIVCAAAPLGAEVERACADRLGCQIIQGFGMTELSGLTMLSPLDPARARPGSVGVLVPSMEARVVDVATGEDLDPGARGELWLRGPNVMRGYYNKPEATRAVFTEDGWFKTGDIGTIDRDGFLRITDRKKELFKTSGGKYIAPQVIEQLIKGSRFVNQVVLVGNDRKFPAALIVPDWERIESYVRLKGMRGESHAELCRNPRIIDLFERQIAALTPNLAQYERVKRITLLEHELSVEGGELTPTLKVKRRVVDEKYRGVIDQMYAEAERTHPAQD